MDTYEQRVWHKAIMC